MHTLGHARCSDSKNHYRSNTLCLAETQLGSTVWENCSRLRLVPRVLVWLCFWKRFCWLLHSNIGDCMFASVGCGSKLREKRGSLDPYRRSDPATPLAWSSVTFKNLAVHQSRRSVLKGVRVLRKKGRGGPQR